MSENAFTRILNRLEEAESADVVKVASANKHSEKTAETRLLEVVKSVGSTEKTAEAQNTPAASLEQMAKQAHESEQELLLKQAHTMGAALADGFMERFAQYDTALAEQGVKTASTPDTALLKEAVDHGYKQAIVDMEKRAEEEYQRGYEEQMQSIHKIAAEIHYAGQTVAHNLIEKLKAK